MMGEVPVLTGDGDRRRPRVAVLWSYMTGYMHVMLRALVDEGADVLLCCRGPQENAPYDRSAITAGLRTTSWSTKPDVAALTRELDDFDPDAILVLSWGIGGYRTVARRWRGRTLRIMGMENQWMGTPKQWGGRVLAPLVLRPAYDVVLVNDERQAAFAARLGFPAERLIWGLYSGDYRAFSAIARQRGDSQPPASFLFVGRLVPVKAVDVMAAAYARYRQVVDDPWPLMVAGTGPDAALFDGIAGVDQLGFVQPADLPAVCARAGCFVLPSRFEPWGVVIHEAAAAGLPVICSRACGASTRLVLDGFNGVVVTPGDVEALAGAFVRMHRLTDHERQAMGSGSELLARQYTPERWAQNLLRRIPELREQLGLGPVHWAPAQQAEAPARALDGEGSVVSS